MPTKKCKQKIVNKPEGTPELVGQGPRATPGLDGSPSAMVTKIKVNKQLIINKNVNKIVNKPGG